MAGAKHRMLELLKEKVGKEVYRDLLSEVANTHEWARSIRTLREEGWDIETTKAGYILHSLIQLKANKERFSISTKLRYQVLQRDNSTCQRCGKTIKDGITLEVDHKIPVDWGGTNDLDNLWTLCNKCNGGKRNFFSDFDASVMTEVSKEKSGYRKLVRFFELNPNLVLEPWILEAISHIRDWTRTIRLIREKEKMNIQWIDISEEYPKGGYIFKK